MPKGIEIPRRVIKTIYVGQSDIYGGITELQGRMGDAWALGGEEGRDKLRKATVRGKYPLTRGYPNGATRRERSRHPD